MSAKEVEEAGKQNERNGAGARAESSTRLAVLDLHAPGRRLRDLGEGERLDVELVGVALGADYRRVWRSGRVGGEVAGDAAAEAQPVGVRRGEENAPSVTTMSTERSPSLQAPDPSQRTSKQAPQPPSGSAPKKGFPRLSAPVEKYGLQNVQWSGSGERSVGWLIGWLIGWLVGLGILFPVLGAPRVLGDRPVAAGALRGAKGGGARVHPVWCAAEEGCARRGGGGRRGG